jgi:acyl-coenzyme A thioesterase PaaI-like protein
VTTRANTHLEIDAALVGTVSELAPGSAIVELETTSAMSADAEGLVHGGFVFGAADYAAMLAVNDPNVVLGSAETRFLAPLRVGQSIRLVARVDAEKGKKRVVLVEGSCGDQAVFTGTFTCFVLEQHVLQTKD